MTAVPTPRFPGGSKQRVNRAGDAVRNGVATDEDVSAIDEWRAAHRAVLNTFQAILRNRTRGTEIYVAQRHKRKRTIYDKLGRLPGMQLARMDDVAGCRLIFRTIEELYEFRRQIHAARFKHQLRNDKDKYDYIKVPKSTGYRGVHDVYSYDVSSAHGRHFRGLLLELQYRTVYQHAWATCVEVVGFITASQPKFERGDQRYQEIFKLASEIIARVHEGRTSCLPDLDNDELVKRFLSLDGELNLMRMLLSLNAADSQISGRKNVILIMSDESVALETMAFRDATDALRALFELEKEHPTKDIVLVKADSSEEVRFAFKNYFSDAGEFIEFIERGVERLASQRVVYVAPDFFGEGSAPNDKQA